MPRQFDTGITDQTVGNIEIDGESVSTPYEVDSDSITETAAQLEFDYEAVIQIQDATGEPYEYELQFITAGDVDVADGFVSSIFGTIQGALGFAEGEITFRWQEANLGQIQREIDNLFTVYPVDAPIGDALGPIRDIQDHTIETDFERGFSQLSTVPFRQIPVPAIDELQDAVDQLEPLEIDVVAQPDGLADELIALIQGAPTMTLELPPSIFIRWVDPAEEIPCLERYEGKVDDIDGLSGRIGELSADVSNVEARIDSMISNIAQIDGISEGDLTVDRDALESEAEDIADDIVSANGGGVFGFGLLGGESDLPEPDDSVDVLLPDVVEAFQEDEQVEFTEREIEEWEAVIGDSVDVVSEFNRLTSDIESLSSNIEDEVSGECIEELEEVFDENVEPLSDIVPQIAYINAISEELDFVLDLRNEILLDRGDIPRSVINQVEQFVAAVQELSPPVRPERIEQLLDEGQDAIEAVEAEVDPRNPAKSELLSRVNTSKSTLRTLRDEGVDELPCSQQYPDVDEVVSEVESLISEIDRAAVDEDGVLLDPVGPVTDVDDIFDELDDAASEVVDIVDDPDCINHFEDRIDAATAEAQGLLTGIRVDEDAIGDAEERRAEIRQRIEDRLEDVVG